MCLNRTVTVLRGGTQFNIIMMEASLADLWRRAGWEVGPAPFDSQYEAQLVMERWKTSAPK
jgi:hypothetical protein